MATTNEQRLSSFQGLMTRLESLHQEHDRLKAIPTTPRYRLASIRLAIRTIRDELLTKQWLNESSL
jgi:hypothetical protein